MKLKRDWFRFLWLAVAAVWLAACGGGTDAPTSADEGPGVRGQVLAVPDGEPLAGVEIYTTEDGVLARTDAQGKYVLHLPAGTQRTLRLRKDGYTSQSFPVTIGDTLQGRDFSLRQRGPVVRIPNAENGFEYTDPQGARVVIPPGGLVYLDGQGQEQPVQGDVLLQVTPVDVSDDREVWAFPGRFAGTDISGNPAEMILSYGTVEFVFTLPDGTPVNLSASAPPATIEIPVFVTTHPDGSAIQAGNSNQAVWSLDETTGLWIQESDTGVVVESTASPTGLALRAKVTHFSWWNYDIKPVAGGTCYQQVSIRGIPPGREATLRARTVVYGAPRFASRQVGRNGDISVLVPAGRVTFEALVDEQGLFYMAGPIEMDTCGASGTLILDLTARPPEIRRFEARVQPVFSKDANGSFVVTGNDVMLTTDVLGANTLTLTNQTIGEVSNLLPRQKLVRTAISGNASFLLEAANVSGSVSGQLNVMYVANSAPYIRSAYVTWDPSRGLNTYLISWDVEGADAIEYGYVATTATDLTNAAVLGRNNLLQNSLSITLPDANRRDIYIRFINGSGEEVRRFTVDRSGQDAWCDPVTEICGPA